MGKRRLSRQGSAREKQRARKPWMVWSVVGGLIVLVGGIAAYYLLSQGPSSMASTGLPAPDFTLKLFDGQSVALSSLRGRPVLVNFWAST